MFKKIVKAIEYDVWVDFKEDGKDAIVTSKVKVEKGKATIERANQAWDVPLSLDRLQAVSDLFRHVADLVRDMPVTVPVVSETV